MVQNQRVSKKEVDDYLETLKQPQKSTLEILRKTILEVLPKAEQCISYQVPTFKVDGKAIAGFASFKNRFSYFPMSGSVLNKLGKEVAKYQTSKGTLQFGADNPLSKALVKKLIRARMAEAFPKKR
jgi:uncharacterized protein YdhG (YjbR/CyaY superfamily)